MLNNKKCKDCYFYRQCRQNSACDDFTPMIDDSDDTNLIEKGRDEFHSEWYQYISDNQD